MRCLQSKPNLQRAKSLEICSLPSRKQLRSRKTVGRLGFGLAERGFFGPDLRFKDFVRGLVWYPVLRFMRLIFLAFRAVATFLLLHLAVNAVAQSSASARESLPKPPQNETPVLFTGFPAIFELAESGLRSVFGKAGGETRCGTFTLLSYAGVLPEVRVTASGLGLVDFSASGKNASNEVTIANVDSNGIKVGFCVRGELVREPGTSAQGKLVAFAAGYKPASVGIKVDRPNLSPRVKALQWFFAILVPAIIAGIFGLGSAWGTNALTQRRDQKSAFRKFKDERWEDLSDFFHAYLQNMVKECQTKEQFARRLREELQTRGYWALIPWKERDRIERFIRQNETSRMTSILAILFSEWKSDLSELEK